MASGDEAAKNLEQALGKIYYGEYAEGSRRGIYNLYKEAKKQGVPGVTLAKCRAFLETQEVYTKYRPARKNYPRNRIIARMPGHVVQCDLMDMVRFVDENDGIRWLFVSTDTFSKYLAIVPMKGKSIKDVKEALKILLRHAPFPWSSIYFDQEPAIVSKEIRAFLKERNVRLYTTTSVVKAPQAEGMIRLERGVGPPLLV